LFGVDLFAEGFQTWTVMVLPSGGFFAMALWLIVVNWLRERQNARAGKASKVAS